jgi:tetratricopeptide (TPR) repeat protein
LQAQVVAIAGQLAKTPEDFGEWIGLGGIRKSAGDYQGAIAVWHYVTILYPNDSTAFINLADLYANYLKDYSKANTNYQAAIKINPALPDVYRNLFALYTTTSYKPSATAAEDILKSGIAANAKAVDLQVLLARYYKSAGRASDASAEYAAAVSNAQSQGNQALATQIQQEASITSN